MKPRRSPLFPVLVALSAAIVPAVSTSQAKPAREPDAAASASIPRTAHGVSTVDGELWGLGPDYKARFRAGGFDFHPALGDRADHNLPLSFELESIERGGAAVLAHAAPAEPTLGEDDVVRYARAFGIEERYAMRADGIEQSFVFAQPLPGSGDLVVRGRLASELVAPLGAHTQLDFRIPDVGGVRYGAVAGVDADGRTAAGSLRYDGLELSLVLPAAFVDAARYPLVLDPLIGTSFFIAADPGLNDTEPDVAYDLANDLFLVVWNKEYSTTDWDIRGQRVSANGSPIGGLIPIETAVGTVAVNPTVANVRSSQRFAVAWQQRSTADYDIRALAVSAVDGALSTNVLTAANTAADEIDPDLAGEQTLLAEDVLLVWERQDAGIYGTRIKVPVAGINPGLVSNFTVAADSRAYVPAISKSGGAAGRDLVVYNVLYAPGDVDVFAALLDRAGNVLVPAASLAQSSVSESAPDVDGDGTAFLVAYIFGPYGGEDSELFCTRVTYDSAAMTLQYGSSSGITADTVNQYAPAVAWTPGKAFVAWQQEYPGSLFDTDIYVKGIDPTSCGECEAVLTLDFSSTWDGEPELASAYSGGSTGDHVFATWYSGIASLFSVDQSDVKGQLLEAFGAGGTAVSLGGGCGAGGTISTSGPIAPGNPNFAIKLTGADPLAGIGVLILHPPAAPYVCGSCSVILPGSLFTVPLAGGAGSKTLPIPCQAALLGIQLDAQWAVLPTASVACPLFGNVAASSRLRLTVGQ